MNFRDSLIEVIEKTARWTCSNPPTYIERQFIRPEDLGIKLYNVPELADAIIEELDKDKAKNNQEQLMINEMIRILNRMIKQGTLPKRWRSGNPQQAR